jgi:hypothetical protein
LKASKKSRWSIEWSRTKTMIMKKIKLDLTSNVFIWSTKELRWTSSSSHPQLSIEICLPLSVEQIKPPFL